MKSEIVFGFENANWPALLLDEEGRVRRANGSAVKLFGPVLEGAGPQLAAIWSPENPLSAEKFVGQWLRSPTPINRLKLLVRGGGTQLLTAFLCATSVQGEKILLLQVPPDHESVATGAQSPGSDAATAQKQKLDCALQLARTVALDFNNALTSILGHTSYALGQLDGNSPWRASLVEIEKAAARAAEIANDLGTFSRQEPETPTQAAGNLNRVVQAAMDIFRCASGTQGRTIEWADQLERRLYASRFNEAQIQQAIVRIFENAVEAIQSSGRISVITRNIEATEPLQDRGAQLPRGHYVCIEVSDDGEGIPPQVLPRIFEPFFGTKGGTHRGLGLAWVYGIVTNHCGAVSVNSQPKQGTQVRVYLPAEARVLRDAGLQAGDLRGSQTILMVDDEDLLLTMGETILSAYGYRVLTANNGPRALEILEAMSPIELVITDMVMPQMSGRELVDRVRKLAPQTRIIRTSGYVRPAREREDVSYLQKPFSCEELLLKVKQILSEDIS
jgi:two-component system cell cycle sensor histidine kinase/response regulator CckA